jgi:hypothetical protein
MNFKLIGYNLSLASLSSSLPTNIYASVGWVPQFYDIYWGSVFTNKFTKRFGSPYAKISMLNKSINIFFKTINEFPQCWFLEILKTTNYPLPILTNRVLLFFIRFFFKIEIKIK